MIFFKPEILTEKARKFTAFEDGVEYGYCLMKIESDFAEVYELQFDADKPYIVEGLLRSAYNSASLDNVYMGRCTCRNIDPFLNRMNFEKTDNGYVNDIPSILMGSCCK